MPRRVHERSPILCLLLIVVYRDAYHHRATNLVGQIGGSAGTLSRPSLCALRAILAVLLLLAERSDRIVAMGGELCRKASNADTGNGMQPDGPGVRPERAQRPTSKIILVVFGGLYISRQL